MNTSPVESLKRDPSFQGFLGKGLAGKTASIVYLTMIWNAIETAGGNLTEAGRVLQQSTSSLSRLVRRMGWQSLVDDLRRSHRA